MLRILGNAIQRRCCAPIPAANHSIRFQRGFFSELTDTDRRPTPKISYRNSHKQKPWQLVYQLPEVLILEDMGDMRKRLFLEAMHIDKLNKDYETMFDKLGVVSGDILSRGAAISEVDLIYLRSLIHHAVNTRYAYDSKRIAQTDIVARVEHVVAGHQGESGMHDTIGLISYDRVIQDGPTWWQDLLNRDDELILSLEL